MTSTYKRLGDYIRQVDVRNKDLKVERLLGVNLSKEFIPSVANTIGTDMSKYKIIKKNQFGCKLMSVGRDGIMPISLYKQDAPSLISSAYYVFEVNNQDELLPDFLFMWLIRPEFDRQLAFYAGADVRGGVTWDFLCDMPIIVPSIDRQRALVAQYESLSRRIRINEQMIATLEDTAQALYRKMFVEGIDKENLPEGWRMGTLGEVADCYDKLRKPLSQQERALMPGEYPYFGAISQVDSINQYIYDGIYLLFSEDGANIVDENGHPAMQYVCGKFWVNNHAHVLQGNETVSTEYLLLSLSNTDVRDLVTGAAQPKINQENMNSIKIMIPSSVVMRKFSEAVCPIYKLIITKTRELSTLRTLQSLLLTKLSNA